MEMIAVKISDRYLTLYYFPKPTIFPSTSDATTQLATAWHLRVWQEVASELRGESLSRLVNLFNGRSISVCWIIFNHLFGRTDDASNNARAGRIARDI
jgi:hypothetical protein